MLRQLPSFTIFLSVLLGACSGGSSTPDRPSVETRPATAVTATGATLNMFVNPHGIGSEALFFWGGDFQLSNDYSAGLADIGSGSNTIRLSADLTGLAPAFTYYFKGRASNNRFDTNGDILSFTTPDDNRSHWARSYGREGGDDTLRSIVFTSDGGFAIAGELDNSIASELWVMKWGADDEIEWQRSYSGIGFFEAWDIVETSDGHLLVAGSAPDPDPATNLGEPYPWLLKLDMSGAVVWEKRYLRFGFFRALVATADGGAILFADTITDNDPGLELNVGIYKVDGDGEIDWHKQVGSSLFDRVISVAQSASGYVVVGETSLALGGLATYSPPWVFEIDPAGNLLWQQLYACDFRAEELHVLPSGDMLIAGENEDGGGLLQIDSDGDYRWMRVYDGDDFKSLDVNASGEIFVTGCFDDAPGCSIGIGKLDSTGSPLWARTYPFVRRDGEPSDSGSTRLIRQRSNDDLVFLGRYETRQSDRDAQIMILPADGDLGSLDLAHNLDDSLELCLHTDTTPLSLSNASDSTAVTWTLHQPARSTAFLQAVR